MAGSLSALYGLGELVETLSYAAVRGFGANITTMIDERGSCTHDWVPYTRPIWCDIAYGAAFLLVGVAVVFFVHRIARGAAFREELGGPDAKGPGRPIGF